MIINSDNCTNVASFIMVTRLNLNTIKYEIPYQLQWLNDNIVVKMNRHMLIPLSLDMYKDKEFAMLFLSLLITYCQEGFGNLIEKPSMMDLRTCIMWKMMEELIHLHH